jgi:cell wall-associated NlpC family hydrolase
MSPLIRKVLSVVAAVAVPAGIAAAFACAAPAASAATAASDRPAAAASTLSTSFPQARAVTGRRDHRRRQHRHRLPARLRAWTWAVTQTGAPYVYGGTGPGYDCSGLVMMAYRHAGIHLPRTTYEMLSSPLLVKVIHPRMGDLAFYGSGHVELFRRWGYTFGAHDYGQPVGIIHYGSGWKPTAFYRVR